MLSDEALEARAVVARYGPLGHSEVCELLGWRGWTTAAVLSELSRAGDVEVEGPRFRMTEKGLSELDEFTEWREDEA